MNIYSISQKSMKRYNIQHLQNEPNRFKFILRESWKYKCSSKGETRYGLMQNFTLSRINLVTV